MERKALHQQRDYDSLYCDVRFVTEVWNRTHNISEVCLNLYLRQRPQRVIDNSNHDGPHTQKTASVYVSPGNVIKLLAGPDIL